MKFLHAAVLSATFIGWVIASRNREIRLRKAIDESDLATIKEWCEEDKNWSLCNAGLKYAVETKDPDFVIKYIRQVRLVSRITLTTLYEKGSKAAIEEVLEEINFHQADWVYAASQPEILCTPEKFIDILSKITTPKDQKSAVGVGIWNLFYTKLTDCINPLLAALEKEKLLNEHLMDITIQEIFKQALPRFYDGTWAKRYYDHPAITPEVYAYALICSGRHELQAPGFQWLLTTADHEDLLAVQKSDDYRRAYFRFRHLIEKAVSKVKPGISRLDDPIRRVKIAERTLDKIPHVRMSKEIVDIIGAYVTRRTSTRKRAEITKQIINEILGASPAIEIISQTIRFYVDDDVEADMNEGNEEARGECCTIC